MPFVLVVVVAGLTTVGAYAERQPAPTEDACKTILDYHRSAPGGEDRSDAWDRLHYVETRLAKATSPEAVAIREYLAYVGTAKIAGLVPRELAPERDGLASRTGTERRLLVRAAQACTELGHPELQDYLNDDTREEDYAPP